MDDDKYFFINEFKYMNNNYDFELFVLYLLEIYAKYNDIKIKPRYKDRDNKVIKEFDAIFPNGFDDLEGPTILEIKLKTINYSLEKYIHEVINFYPKYKSLLLIIGTNLKENDYNSINKSKNILPEDFKLKVWDLDDINKLVKSVQPLKYGEYVC